MKLTKFVMNVTHRLVIKIAFPGVSLSKTSKTIPGQQSETPFPDYFTKLTFHNIAGPEHDPCGIPQRAHLSTGIKGWPTAIGPYTWPAVDNGGPVVRPFPRRPLPASPERPLTSPWPS